MDKINILSFDLEQTHKFIDKCDDHIFKIQNWALVTASAIIAYSISDDHAYIVLANVFVIVAFLYLELIYKSFQDAAIDHQQDMSRRMDKYLENKSAPDIIEDYRYGFGSKLRYPSVAHVFLNMWKNKHWHILNFYVLIAIFSMVVFAFKACG